MIETENNGQGDYEIVMQDPQEISAEQQAANQQETQTQAANTAQAINSREQQPFAQAQPSSEGRIAKLEMQLAQALKEAADNKNGLLRALADVDNIRKRQERQVTDRVQQQKKALFKQVLEVMDNVERALVYQETMDKQELQQILRMLQW